MFKRSIALLLLALFTLCLPVVAFAADVDLVQPAEFISQEQLAELPSIEVEAIEAEAVAQSAQAAHEGEPVGSVKVSVINDTFIDGAPWSGKKLDEVSVPIYKDSTMLNAATDALTQNNIPFVFDEKWGGYISSIDNMEQGMGSASGGWLLSLNDWFTDKGAGEFSVANGGLKDGDNINILYSMDYGKDIGSDFYSNDKSLKSASFSTGTLNTAFASDKLKYTLVVPEGTKSISAFPVATNKNFQVRAYLNGEEYAKNAVLPIKAGSVITIKCGDPSWPTMNAEAIDIPATSYQFTISNNIPAPPKPANLKATATVGGTKLSWSKSEGADAYIIYRSTTKSGGYKSVRLTKSSKFTDTQLKSGKLYYYKVIPYTVVDGGKLKGKTAGPVAVRIK